MKQVELAEKSRPNNSKQPRISRLILILASLVVTGLVGYGGWREIKLKTAQKLIYECLDQQTCEENVETLERLVQAKKKLKLLNLPDVNLENAHLEGAYIPSANLENTQLENAHLENAHLENANLAIAQLKNAHLENAHLKNVNLSNAHLEGANLQGANLQGAHVIHDHLEGAHLNRANLQGVHIYDTDFKRTNFERANLSQTYFYRSNFDQSNLYAANLKGAYLIEAQNLTTTQIKSACYWSTAIYKGIWSTSKSQWVIDETANQQYIQELKQDTSSNPQEPVDCSQWD